MQTSIHTRKIDNKYFHWKENPEKLANASYKIKCETNWESLHTKINLQIYGIRNLQELPIDQEYLHNNLQFIQKIIE